MPMCICNILTDNNYKAIIENHYELKNKAKLQCNLNDFLNLVRMQLSFFNNGKYV